MISFRELMSSDADLLLKWRTSDHVAKFMATEVVNDLGAQQAWLQICCNKPDYYHWIILHDEIPIGLINLTQYSEADAITSFGLYIGEASFMGYGAFIPPYFYNFLFEMLHIKEIHAEVFYNNVSVIGLHLLHGFKFSPKKDRVIKKNNAEILLISMILEEKNWNKKRLSKNQAVFPVLNWKARPKK